MQPPVHKWTYSSMPEITSPREADGGPPIPTDFSTWQHSSLVSFATEASAALHGMLQAKADASLAEAERLHTLRLEVVRLARQVLAYQASRNEAYEALIGLGMFPDGREQRDRARTALRRAGLVQDDGRRNVSGLERMRSASGAWQDVVRDLVAPDLVDEVLKAGEGG
jgi:hypothetical protein